MTPAALVDEDRLFSIFSNLLMLESKSKAETEVAAYVRDFLEGIGMGVFEDEAGRLTGGGCGNLIAKFTPSKRNSPKPIMLNAHMDTVASTRGLTYQEEEGELRSSGNTILGADDKAGIAIILSVIEALKKGGVSCPIEAVFTVQEEIGLVGAKKIDFSMLESDWGLILDGSGPPGGIVIEAPGREDLTFSIKGKAAHAGIEPEKGKNSIECAARAIAKLKSGRLSDNT
ncbi:MAG: M20/M25/M40 family metallo-hydrolase, partial [Actinomycetota bacterium]|nr:M20/M25/M40 family metallo-hydrolase [Actinomycetota bacterium]